MRQQSKEYDFKLAQAAGLALDRWPESDEEAKRAEEFLAKELQALSLDEHERVIFDVHGLSSLVNHDEDPQMVAQALDDLQVELDQISHDDKEAYHLALDLNSTYVQSPKFRLLFLRCEDFDAKAAAKMMVAHFHAKRQAFGSGEILARDVRQSDLNATDLALLRTGYTQILPTRDASGRTILFLTSSNISEFPDDYQAINEFRVIFYQTMAVLRDEETQKSGSVYLLFNFNSYKVSVQDFRGIASMQATLPQKILGGHYCYNDPALTPYIRGFQIMVSEHARTRMRVHCAQERSELDFVLQTYGIPTEAIPILPDGSVSKTHHYTWLEMLRSQEEQEESRYTLVCTTTTTPTPPVIPTVAICEYGDNPTQFEDAVANKLPEPSLEPEITEIDIDAEEDREKETAGGGNFIGIPRRFDVLFGKSALVRDHTGTRRALHVVEMYFEEYEAATGKFQKTDIAERIISIIHESGGRFLKQKKDGSWMEASEVEAKRKIAHWFRHSRSKKKMIDSSDKRDSECSSIANTDLRPLATDANTTRSNARPIKRSVTPQEDQNSIASAIPSSLLNDATSSDLYHHDKKKAILA